MTFVCWTLFKSRSNLAQTSLKACSNLAQTSLKCSESNAPNRRFESTLRINASNQGSANKCHSLYSLDIGIGTIGIVISLYEKCHIGILSVSADKKTEFIGLYRYWPIWKKAYRSYTADSFQKCCNDLRLGVVGLIYLWPCLRCKGNFLYEFVCIWKPNLNFDA